MGPLRAINVLRCESFLELKELCSVCVRAADIKLIYIHFEGDH